MATRQLDFYDAKGAVEAALEALGASEIEFSAAEIKHLRAGQTAVIRLGGVDIGSLGRLNDEIAATYKFKQSVFVGEIDLGVVLSRPSETAAYQPLSRFPGISRDVSFVAPRSVTLSDIQRTVESQGFELCKNVEFVDVYEGKGLGENERSITIRLEYRSPERTLVEDEVEALHQQILTAVEQYLSIKQRA